MLKLNPSFVKSHLQLIWQFSRRFITSSSANNVERATTVDAKEVDAFSRAAQIWWDPKGLYKALHALNVIRVPYIVEDLQNHGGAQSLENKTILDVGCGGGLLCEELAKSGVKVTGIDASKELIDVALQHSISNEQLMIKPKYIYTTIEEHANENENYYDRVVASEVIEHINNKELFVKACLQALKPGGKIVITCPSKTRLSHLLNIVFAENVMNNPPKGTHQYDKFITPRELELMLKSNGCNVEEVRGFALNMLTNTWKWTRSQTLYFAMRAVKVN